MMIRVLDGVRAYMQLAWWDGSSVDLRLHRILDLVAFGATPSESRLALAPALAARRERP